MGILEVIIESGIGFLGFAGVVIALSGNPKHWRYEEKLRIGLMLVLFFTPLFMSFLCLILALVYPPQIFGFWLSLATSGFIIFSCVSFFLLARKYYATPGTTLNVGVAVFGQSTLLLMSLVTLVNAFFEFAPILPMLIGLLVWSLFMGAVIFLRILFIRPGAASRK